MPLRKLLNALRTAVGFLCEEGGCPRMCVKRGLSPHGTINVFAVKKWIDDGGGMC